MHILRPKDAGGRMNGFLKKFYVISCGLMAVITVIALIVTIYIGTGGTAPGKAPFWNAVVLFSLGFMGVLTVVCLCISSVGGKSIYKIGFYILHSGLVILVIGFLITNLASKDAAYKLTALSVRQEAITSVQFYDGDGDGKDDKLLSTVVLEKGIALQSITTETYENGQPKHYEAVLAFVDKNTGKTVDTAVLTVNHPIRYQGLKIYLMTAEKDSVGLLIKSNPGEFVVIAGIVILTLGTFVMCFSEGFSFRSLFAFKKRESANEQPSGKKVKTNA
jgi:hypothetical protein